MAGEKHEVPEGFIRYIGVKIVHGRPAPCPEDGMGKYKAGDPGYDVMYEDGYMSWSPQCVFYEAYRSTKNMSFGLATEAMKRGFNVARRGWNGKGIFCAIQDTAMQSCMSSPYIFIDRTGLQTDNKDAPKSRVPWLASQADMLSDDWFIKEYSDDIPEQRESVEEAFDTSGVFQQYKRKGLSEMRPYIKGEDLSKVSVADVDDPETDMGMVARNPLNPDDQWYVARKYFDENLEQV